MKILVKFKTMLNVIWASDVGGREAFAFMRGFPALFLMTQSRAIIIAEFLEKKGWFKKHELHTLCFEAGLHMVDEYKMNFVPKKNFYTATISFKPHGQVGDGALIHFLKMEPRIWKVIEKHLKGLVLKNPVKDSGIVHVDSVLPRTWLKERYGIKVD